MIIKAVGFDLDGTLYPAGALYLHMVPNAAHSLKLFSAFNRVRHRLRDEPTITDIYRSAPPTSIDEFHRSQAHLVAESVGMDEEAVYQHIERYFYRGSEDCFSSIKMFPGVQACLSELRSMGLALGLLSDFPAQRKLELMGLGRAFDVVATSESTGLLKPDTCSFAALAKSLGCTANEVLYVGNSERYDVAGAKAAGMHSAFISTCRRARLRSQADFSFSRYSQLLAWLRSKSS
ncbi:MAG TPA: HAD family hydrolase [Spirochaetales bacterium]|nr:HAD family hydrolase [Spirochaetales bacterium]